MWDLPGKQTTQLSTSDISHNKEASRLKAHFFISDMFKPCSLTIAGNLFSEKH